MSTRPTINLLFVTIPVIICITAQALLMVEYIYLQTESIQGKIADLSAQIDATHAAEVESLRADVKAHREAARALTAKVEQLQATMDRVMYAHTPTGEAK
jgi:cell division protein FtsL